MPKVMSKDFAVEVMRYVHPLKLIRDKTYYVSDEDNIKDIFSALSHINPVQWYTSGKKKDRTINAISSYIDDNASNPPSFKSARAALLYINYLNDIQEFIRPSLKFHLLNKLANSRFSKLLPKFLKDRIQNRYQTMVHVQSDTIQHYKTKVAEQIINNLPISEVIKNPETVGLIIANGSIVFKPVGSPVVRSDYSYDSENAKSLLSIVEKVIGDDDIGASEKVKFITKLYNSSDIFRHDDAVSDYFKTIVTRYMADRIEEMESRREFLTREEVQEYIQEIKLWQGTLNSMLSGITSKLILKEQMSRAKLWLKEIDEKERNEYQELKRLVSEQKPDTATASADASNNSVIASDTNEKSSDETEKKGKVKAKKKSKGEILQL